MHIKLSFTNAENERIKLTSQQQKQIQDLYTSVSKDIEKQLRKAPRVPSDALRKQYLTDLQKQVDTALKGIQNEIQGIVENNMHKVSQAVVEDNIDFLKSAGLSFKGAFSHVPDETVRVVATGQLYEGNWTLSKALWKQTKKTQQDVETVVAKGIAENKSAFDIAKDLEKYVDPKAKKEWDWSKVYPGTNRKVDYNAQRLARTMVSHAYQRSFVQTTKNNPFVLKYQWRSSGGERTCPICADRDGQKYDKDSLPLDHPNGMCTFIAVMDDMDTIADRLSSWAKGNPDPEMDEYISSMGNDFESKQPVRTNPFGFAYSKKRYSIEDDAILSNPYYNSGNEYNINCQRCVPTYEMRRRGFDVKALPYISETDPAYVQWKNIFKGSTCRFTAPDWVYLKSKRKAKQADEIRGIMKPWGNGARAEIYVKWSNCNSAHVFAAEVENGEVVFLDPQSGELGKEVEKYFLEAMPSRTSLLRLDDKEVSDLITGCCDNMTKEIQEIFDRGEAASGWDDLKRGKK